MQVEVESVVIEVRGREYKLQKEMLDLDSVNLGVLNDQIKEIAGYYAYVGTAYADAVLSLRTAENDYKIWFAGQLSIYSDLKSEKAKDSAIRRDFKTVVCKHETRINELRYDVDILGVYQKGLEIKYQLSQTLSANLRAEREKYRN